VDAVARLGDALPGFRENDFVPKHKVLKDSETKELFKIYKINEKKLPKILSKDPMVKTLGAKVGDIIKVVRQSPTAGNSKYYRVVV
jgi:DNA-directed RNA polymerase subunit H